ncbi:MAG TPA: peptide chain release factor 2, partial [Planctomycetota bacterium]|nr:peptide chain release factor 2 [Planctomycetota bacterium]
RLASGVADMELLYELSEADGASGLAEFEKTLSDLEAAYDALELQTLLSGPFDRNNAIVTIQAGAGGTDASDWAEMLLRAYSRWGEAEGFKVELLDSQEHEEAGIKSATIKIIGPWAYGYMLAEMGVHRLVRISPFDAQGRRQTSFAALDVAPEVEEEDEIVVDETELRVDTYRAGGKGGQHVNKTESAVRLTHLPTNTVVQCQNERSQHKNKAQAMKMLQAKLAQLREAERNSELQSMYDGKGQIAWGNQIRSYVLAPYTMVKDHRTGHESGNVQSVLDGNFQPFIEAYLKSKVKGSES